MIKGITTIRKTSAKELQAVTELFDALGFERGKGWKTERGHGEAFMAPLGQLEFVEGREELHTDIWVEVNDLDSIREILSKQRFKLTKDIQPTKWGSRFLIAEPAQGSGSPFLAERPGQSRCH